MLFRSLGPVDGDGVNACDGAIVELAETRIASCTVGVRVDAGARVSLARSRVESCGAVSSTRGTRTSVSRRAGEVILAADCVISTHQDEGWSTSAP